MLSFGTLTMGINRVGQEANNGNLIGLADTDCITGNGLLEERSALGVAAANNNSRIDDTATVRMLGNSILRLTSLKNAVTTETINTVNVAGGHALIDVVKTGASTAPVGFTLNSVNRTNGSTVNFTG